MLFGREWIRGKGVLDGHTVGRLTIVNIDVGDLGEIKGLAGIRRIDLTRFVEECDFECGVLEREIPNGCLRLLQSIPSKIPFLTISLICLALRRV